MWTGGGSKSNYQLARNLRVLQCCVMVIATILLILPRASTFYQPVVNIHSTKISQARGLVGSFWVSRRGRSAPSSSNSMYIEHKSVMSSLSVAVGENESSESSSATTSSFESMWSTLKSPSAASAHANANLRSSVGSAMTEPQEQPSDNETVVTLSAELELRLTAPLMDSASTKHLDPAAIDPRVVNLHVDDATRASLSGISTTSEDFITALVEGMLSQGKGEGIYSINKFLRRRQPRLGAGKSSQAIALSTHSLREAVAIVNSFEAREEATRKRLQPVFEELRDSLFHALRGQDLALGAARGRGKPRGSTNKPKRDAPSLTSAVGDLMMEEALAAAAIENQGDSFDFAELGSLADAEADAAAAISILQRAPAAPSRRGRRPNPKPSVYTTTEPEIRTSNRAVEPTERRIEDVKPNSDANLSDSDKIARDFNWADLPMSRQ